MFPVLASIVTAICGAALVAAAWVAVTLFRVHLGTLDAIRAQLERLLEGGEKPVKGRLADLEDLVARLPARWEDIRREAARIDARARSVVARARRELAESGVADERLERVADELQLGDGDAGEGDELLAVRNGMAAPSGATPAQPAAESWTEVTRRLKWGG